MPKRKINEELVLVTGGAGFVGSHLVDALLECGYAVRVLDNLGAPTHNGKLPEWFNKKAQFVKGDVLVKKDWERALSGVSYVFHLAAYMDYHLDFSNYFKTNTVSTAFLYELIVERKLPVKKVITASSQSVYGEGKYFCKKHGIVYSSPRKELSLMHGDWDAYCFCERKFEKMIKQNESDELFPVNSYGISKLAIEKIALTLGREYNIPTVVLRYAIIQGTRQSFRHFYSGALRSFVVQTLAGEPIEMHEDAMQTRDFVHINDVTNAHLVVLANKKANYEIFNVGSGRSDTIFNLAKTVSRVVGVEFKMVLKGSFRIGTARNSPMSVEKLKKLNWKPKNTLENNVRDYVEWVKNYPEAIKYLRRNYSDMKKRGIVR